MTWAAWPAYASWGASLKMHGQLYTLISPESFPTATMCPSGSRCTELMLDASGSAVQMPMTGNPNRSVQPGHSKWPGCCTSSRPVRTSKSRISYALLQVWITAPSSLKSTPVMVPLWPVHRAVRL